MFGVDCDGTVGFGIIVLLKKKNTLFICLKHLSSCSFYIELWVIPQKHHRYIINTYIYLLKPPVL